MNLKELGYVIKLISQCHTTIGENDYEAYHDMIKKLCDLVPMKISVRYEEDDIGDSGISG